MPAKYTQTFYCAGEGCSEHVTYGYDTKTDRRESASRLAKDPYRCPKHGSRADEYMTPGNPVRERIFTVTESEPDHRGRITPGWAGDGPFKHQQTLSGLGLGFHAAAREFPPGTRLVITAQAILPETGEDNANG